MAYSFVPHYEVPYCAHQTNTPAYFYNEFATQVDERLTPEKKLLVAIIERAYLDLGLMGVLSRRLARDFFLSNSTDDWSFRWCCQMLEMDYREIRSRIQPAIEASYRTIVRCSDSGFGNTMNLRTEVNNVEEGRIWE